MSLLPREPGKGSASVWPSCSSWPWPGAHGDELTLFKTWFLTWIWSLWVVLASLRKVTNSSLLYSKQKITFPSVLPALSPSHHCPLPHAEDGDQPLATRLPRRVCMWCSLPSCHVLHSCSPMSHRLRDREAAVAAWSQQDVTTTLGLHVPRTSLPWGHSVGDRCSAGRCSVLCQHPQAHVTSLRRELVRCCARAVGTGLSA